MKRPLLIIAVCLLTLACLLVGYLSWRGPTMPGTPPRSSAVPTDNVDQNLVVHASLSTTTLKPGTLVLVRLTLENTGSASTTIRPSWLDYESRPWFFDANNVLIGTSPTGPIGTPNFEAIRQTVTLLPGEKYTRTLGMMVGSQAEWPDTPMPEVGYWALFRNRRVALLPGVHYMYIEVPIAGRVARTETFALEFDAAGGPAAEER